MTRVEGEIETHDILAALKETAAARVFRRWLEKLFRDRTLYSYWF